MMINYTSLGITVFVQNVLKIVVVGKLPCLFYFIATLPLLIVHELFL